MKTAPFRYVKPRSLVDCLALLAEHRESALVLAGGQSLMPMMNLRIATPEVLIDINGLHELRGIVEEVETIVIGALARHAEIAASGLVETHLPLLVQAAPHLAHVAIRSRGTFGGSVALADPAAEWPACCLALGAEIEVSSSARGARRIPAERFFEGVFTTARQPDELLVAVHVPKPRAPRSMVHRFSELSRRHGDFAIAALALVADRDGSALRGIRIALAGVADRPVLAPAATREIDGRPLDDASIARAVAALRGELDPPDDPAHPGAYRRHVAGVLLERTLRDLAIGEPHAA